MVLSMMSLARGHRKSQSHDRGLPSHAEALNYQAVLATIPMHSPEKVMTTQEGSLSKFSDGSLADAAVTWISVKEPYLAPEVTGM